MIELCSEFVLEVPGSWDNLEGMSEALFEALRESALFGFYDIGVFARHYAARQFYNYLN